MLHARPHRPLDFGEQILKDDIRPGGNLMQGTREEFWIWPNERRQMWAENAFSYDVNVPASRGATIRVALDQGNRIDAGGDLGFDGFGAIGPLADFYGPANNGAARWMRRIKLRFDKHAVNEAALDPERWPMSDNAEAGGSKRLDLMPPRESGFRKTMHQQQQRPLALLGNVEVDPVALDDVLCWRVHLFTSLRGCR